MLSLPVFVASSPPHLTPPLVLCVHTHNPPREQWPTGEGRVLVVLVLCWSCRGSGGPGLRGLGGVSDMAGMQGLGGGGAYCAGIPLERSPGIPLDPPNLC